MHLFKKLSICCFFITFTTFAQTNFSLAQLDFSGDIFSSVYGDLAFKLIHETKNDPASIKWTDSDKSEEVVDAPREIASWSIPRKVWIAKVKNSNITSVNGRSINGQWIIISALRDYFFDNYIKVTVKSCSKKCTKNDKSVISEEVFEINENTDTQDLATYQLLNVFSELARVQKGKVNFR